MINFLYIPRDSAERMYLLGPKLYSVSDLVKELRDERMSRIRKLHEMLNGVENKIKELKVK